jgi:hypothetical protein
MLMISPGLRSVVRGDEIATIRFGVEARLNQLQNWTAQFTETTVYVPSPQKLDPPAPGVTAAMAAPLSGSYVRESSFAFLNGRAKSDWRLDADTITRMAKDGIEEVEQSSEVYTPERYQAWMRRASRPSDGIIAQSGHIGRQWSLDLVLGLRVNNSDEWLSAKQIGGLTFSKGENGLWIGKSVRNNGLQDVWTFDPALGYAVRSYKIIRPEGMVIGDFIATDFREVNGVQMPFAANYTARTLYEGKLIPVWTKSFAVTTYHVDDPSNTKDKYDIAWPEGTILLDERTNLTFTIKSGKQATVGDDEIYAKSISDLETRQPASSPTLTGSYQPLRPSSPLPLAGAGVPATNKFRLYFQIAGAAFVLLALGMAARRRWQRR